MSASHFCGASHGSEDYKIVSVCGYLCGESHGSEDCQFRTVDTAPELRCSVLVCPYVGQATVVKIANSKWWLRLQKRVSFVLGFSLFFLYGSGWLAG